MDNLKKIIFKLYTIALMLFTIWYGTFIFPVIFGHYLHDDHDAEHAEEQADDGTSEEEKLFQKMLAEQSQMAETDLGYRVIKEQYVKGHFHHTGFSVEFDTQSVCIRCHGDVPHDKAKAIRAFLNMHAFYLACETCHIQPSENQEDWTFRWYDKKTGKAVGNPPGLVSTEIDRYGNYGAKVAPGIVKGDKFQFLNGDKEKEFAEEYLKKKDLLAPTQQSKMKKVIHRMVNDQPLFCDKCHQPEDPYLPFAKLGYPRHRVNDLTGTEVVGMVQKYKAFYIPKFLMPGEAGNVPQSDAF